MARLATTPGVRCAVYTRKSSEEGLEQAFNSLHAQREACEAYIKSQAGEGWTCRPAAYDDGGISGGTMERPALQRLLADIERGLIDCVVVYKVDRLTRSLTDFARIIDVFDRKGVSFVSVTQAFNTTTSMGRLTLNVLLSFAQFEREVTGERIRDKIAASKRKGMWMGGVPPLGYDIPKDQTSRALVVNSAEAEQVRDIFRRYLRLKSVNAVRDELARDGQRSKIWTTRSGRHMGGVAFNTGSLFHLLRSRVYVGQIVHGEERYAGAHQAIVERDLFEAVQTQLTANARVRRARPTAAATLPLQGRIFDAEGQRMGPTFAYSKSGKRHAYYVSVPLQRAIKSGPEVIGRLSAGAFEALVLERLRGLSANPDADWPDLLPILRRIDVEAHGLRLSLDRTVLLQSGGKAAMSQLQSRVVAGDQLASDTRNAHTLQLMVPVRPVFRGGRTWMVRPDGQAATARAAPDRQLLKALAQAHAALAASDAAPSMSAEQWRRARSLPESYLRKMAGLAFLAPDIQRSMLEGRQPAGLTGQQLMQQGVPLAWADQRERLGF
ncbi:MAG: recombinase family protein [Phenylobacterium sp.]|uniref:recombinase family protein n=1 Tax=Phenylobacterium sp. TaxID=1871053 RepID=UPI0027363457|nr:recombinase family protein [Phenylobacterium sp.]MDP3747660.1 recombinase family protein [Phenylobacterium sp.]